ncbi:MAG TPA: NUDIX domain-containing protein [Candidatus Thalassarchaeaceae archaeon]|nr:MAG TPA: NUDIX domain-containing protein [Candidatus Poseidoniales archaeon]HIH84857.1 NUDIX domain-containing protein [Candidatus Thalassarchaeaceae archaeon]|tara:strand:- start:169 stop:672 length:504 start_codon:yes stop_codon:yes gene_type:complete
MPSVGCDLGVAACTVSGNQILLVQEATGPYAGQWGMPKGFVEPGELPFDAALRELKEECGIEGDVNGLVGVRETVKHGLISVFLAYYVKPLSMDVNVDSKEIDDFGWFNANQLESVDWVSPTMQSIAASALSCGAPTTSLDLSENRGIPYFVHLMPDHIELARGVSR